ncbi:MAG: cyanophycinase [Bacteroidota bacterium]|jgi:cyanophycinase|nr:cyanophycinase [Bacteroidota bacterium]
MNIPKGKLISVGGSEDKGTGIDPHFAQHTHLNFFEFGILKRILSEMRGIDSYIEVITTASQIPEEVGENYIQAFGKLGCRNVGILHIKKREDALNQEYLERIKKADGVMFTGGNQLRLSMIFGGTEFLKILIKRYNEENFVIAGTSAGAMAMSNTMIYQGSSTGALLKGEVKITTGLALLKNVIIDTHFVTRGRFGRLTQAVAGNPGCIGIGLGEDTGVLITNGNIMEAIGSGLVLIFDGHDIKHSNIADIEEGQPLSIEHMVVHIMAKGNYYYINERKFYNEMNTTVSVQQNH